MKKTMIAALLATAFSTMLAHSALAQNIAIVNGKAVPTARVEALAQQIAKSGRPVTPEMQGQLREEIIAREIFMQEAARLGLDASEDFRGTDRTRAPVAADP